MAQRETVVIKETGSGLGVMLGIVAIILLVAGLWFFLMGPGSDGATDTSQPNEINVNVALPSVAPEP